MKRSTRLLELDASRGMAMFAVCVSHAAELVAGQEKSALGAAMIAFGLIATPTFLLLGGVISGHLATAANETADEYKWRMIDRGLFLLLIAHVALGLVHSTWEPAYEAYSRSFYITDAIGLGLLVAAFTARRVSPKILCLSGGILFIAAWIVSSFFSAHTAAARYLLRLLSGLSEDALPDEGYIVPIAPYIGIFLIGLAGGKYFTTLRTLGATARQVSRLYIRVGITCLAIAIAMKLAWLAIRPQVAESWQMIFYQLTEPRQKLPPGLAYLVAYGGFGVLVAGIMFRAAAMPSARPIVQTLAVVGRASLVIYVLQYWIYFFPARVLHIGNFRGMLVVVLPATLVFLWLVAWCWDKADGNRLYTLGLRRFGRHIESIAE